MTSPSGQRFYSAGGTQRAARRGWVFRRKRFCVKRYLPLLQAAKDKR
jgi:hypothetical protein